MGIVIPPRESKRVGPYVNGSQGGPSAPPVSGKLEQPKHTGKAAPGAYVNGNGKDISMPFYGSGGGGPYLPQKQAQSTRSSAKPLS